MPEIAAPIVDEQWMSIDTGRRPIESRRLPAIAIGRHNTLIQACDLAFDNFEVRLIRQLHLGRGIVPSGLASVVHAVVYVYEVRIDIAKFPPSVDR